MRRTAGTCLMTTVALLLCARAAVSQDKPPSPAVEPPELTALRAAVDAAVAGKPNEGGIKWLGHHFIRSEGDTIYIPFTVGIDRQLAVSGATLYVRAVGQGAPARTSKVSWEASYVVDVPPDGKVSRALALPPGSYDVFVGVKSKPVAAQAGGGSTPAATVTGVVRQELAVPSLTGPELSTSSVILATALEQLPSPLLPEQQEENPYVFGPHKLTPSTDGTFARSSELHLWFMIYGATQMAGKPDVQVDLSFHHRLPEGDRYFNRTLPQELNEKTLSPDFNLTLGHQLVSRFSVALATFEPGDYRVEIKVTDRPSGRSLTSNVNFAVAAS